MKLSNFGFLFLRDGDWVRAGNVEFVALFADGLAFIAFYSPSSNMNSAFIYKSDKVGQEMRLTGR
jgi:hypothetical protein